MKQQATNQKHHSTTAETAVDNTTSNAARRRVIEVPVLRDWPDTQIDTDVVFSPKLRHADCRVYEVLAALARDGYEVYIPLSVLAQILHRSTNTVRRHLKMYIENGVIEMERSKLPDGTNCHRFVIHDCIRDSIER